MEVAVLAGTGCQDPSRVSQHLYGRVAPGRVLEPRWDEAGICQGYGHGMSETMRGEGFHAVVDSGSLVCSGELEEGISATGDSNSSLVQSVKA